MATPRGGKPYCWVTWVSGVLAGDKQCQWAPWFRSHFRFQKKDDGSFDRASWTADHIALVSLRAEELRRDGWTVSLENENSFRLHGQTVTLSGKPDILARRCGEALVVDAKTGKQRHSDWWQVLLYLMALPKCFDDLRGITLRGEVCYRTQRIVVQPEELNADRLAQMFVVLRSVGAEERPDKTPSPYECSACDISAADCPERFHRNDLATDAAVAAEF